MLNGNLKNSTNRGFIELQVLRLVKICVIIQVFFVSDVQAHFFRAGLSFSTKKYFLNK